jgi:hypothetical protein
VGTGTTPPPFDLLEVDGKDLRRAPIEERKGTLAKLLRHPHTGIAYNQHYDADGAIIYTQACALGCEGIVSKQLGSSYRSGRADCWVKVKNPAAPAVRHHGDPTSIDVNWEFTRYISGLNGKHYTATELNCPRRAPADFLAQAAGNERDRVVSLFMANRALV